MNNSFKQAVVYLLAAYILATLAGAVLSIILGYALGLPSYTELGVKPSQSPAYKVTEPFQPFFCLIFYSLFALRYLRRVPKEQLREQAFRLSLFWLIGSVLIDLVLFVLIPHPFGFTPAEFYIDYQPWLTLIYAAIFASPLLVMFLLHRRERAERMPTD